MSDTRTFTIDGFQKMMQSIYNYVEENYGVALPSKQLFFSRDEKGCLDVFNYRKIIQSWKLRRHHIADLSKIADRLNHELNSGRKISWLDFTVQFYSRTKTYIFVNWGYSDIVDDTHITCHFPTEGPIRL
ncbi:MAG: hypothetical protein SPL35_05900 [Bacteroidales bacterium]|nr:hypothetical protein [Bacteroidales bacterium]